MHLAAFACAGAIVVDVSVAAVGIGALQVPLNVVAERLCNRCIALPGFFVHWAFLQLLFLFEKLGAMDFAILPPLAAVPSTLTLLSDSFAFIRSSLVERDLRLARDVKGKSEIDEGNSNVCLFLLSDRCVKVSDRTFTKAELSIIVRDAFLDIVPFSQSFDLFV